MRVQVRERVNIASQNVCAGVGLGRRRPNLGLLVLDASRPEAEANSFFL